MDKNCGNCKHYELACTKESADDDFNCREGEPGDLKITQRQVEILYNLFCNSLSHKPCAETGKKDLVEWFPEVFEQQEFCCSVFSQAVIRGDIFHVRDNNKNVWNTSHGLYQKHCFNCGKKLMSPINKEDS